MAVLNEFDARAKTREQFGRAFYTTSKIDKIVIVPAVIHAWPLTMLLLSPLSGQRSNDSIKSLTGIVWLDLYLQATLAAIQEYA
jgi:hypothetical protein